MKVSAQYAEDHFKELLATAETGVEIEIASDGKPSFKLFLVPQTTEYPQDKQILGAGDIILGAGRGEIVLPTNEEWKAMDREIEDLMVNGPLFPVERQ